MSRGVLCDMAITQPSQSSVVYYLKVLVITSKPCKYTQNLMHATRLHALRQLIKEPTRITEHKKTASDLVFVNNLHRLSHLGHKSLQPVTILLFSLSKKLMFARPMQKFAK